MTVDGEGMTPEEQDRFGRDFLGDLGTHDI